MRIKLLIFDFDGTLADTKQLYLMIVIRVLNNEGYARLIPRVKKYFGSRLGVLLPRIGIRNKKEVERLSEIINRHALNQSTKLKPCLALNSIKPLQERYKTALVTNSLTKFPEKFVEQHNLKFDIILGCEKFSSKHQAFKLLFKKFKLKPREAVYIADRAHDAETARIAGCFSIIISNKYSWNSLSEIRKAKPDFIIHSLVDLKHILKEN